MQINRALLKVLRDVIPGIPPDCTRLVLKLEAGTGPIIECDSVVKNAGVPTYRHARFEVTAIDVSDVIG